MGVGLLGVRSREEESKHVHKIGRSAGPEPPTLKPRKLKNLEAGSHPQSVELQDLCGGPRRLGGLFNYLPGPGPKQRLPAPGPALSRRVTECCSRQASSAT